MDTRVEHDSLGEVEVPREALYGAQTERARRNFQISGYRFPPEFIAAIAIIKSAAAEVNSSLGLLEPSMGQAIQWAAKQVQEGRYAAEFPLDVFQTGSGTSTNMNVNEVIATLAGRRTGVSVHPNDHVNLSQSSNDVIPSAIHISSAIAFHHRLLPSLESLTSAIGKRTEELSGVVKTGRTHLMDAVPIRMGQELSAWESQLRDAMQRLKGALKELLELPIGGTAVGTGLNAPARFGELTAAGIATRTGLSFVPSRNRFARIAAQDSALQASAQLRGVATVLLKISNDLRWMNSGPVSGLGEITLPALQPGSSMMPGKVNPVIPEAVAMGCVHVLGNDAAIATAAQAGAFQLNTMLPLIAWSLLTNIQILANAAQALETKAIAGFRVNGERLAALAARNPILATALAPKIGYEKSAKIAQEAQASGRSIVEIALEQTDLTEQEATSLLDPLLMTRPLDDSE